ncbi:Oxygen-dependent choline dehydrogenase [compost metagenome]
MPALISGNTSAPSMMLGERLADFIKGRRSLLPQAPQGASLTQAEPVKAHV